MLPDNAAPLLALAFHQLLGRPESGSMAFVRCLPPEAVRQLAADARLQIAGWQLGAVIDRKDAAQRWITADEAVEWREDKAEPVLLLIDGTTAGAGMDGIYSAAREIGEVELFGVALELARQKLPHGYKSFARRAQDKARQLAKQLHLAPWQAFAYLCQAILRTEEAGGSLPLLGLWPVAIEDKPDDCDLDKAARLTERLLPLQGARPSPEQRVAALKLGAQDEDVQRALVAFLRESEGMSRLEALTRLQGRPEFWLNRIRPGLFDEQSLQSIEWLTWRGKTGKPQAWSGLFENDDKRLEWRLHLHADNPKERARLEVRWKVEPETLAKGTVDYLVEVRAGQDALAEKTVSHSGKAPQKAVFTQDDFEDIEETARFEAQIVIRALGENPCEAISEDFVLCFGETDKPAKSSAGKVFPTLALAIAHIAPDNEAFKQLARDPGCRQYFGSDVKGYVTCRWDGKVGKVFSPALLTHLGKDWVNRGGPLGRWRLQVRADGTPAGETTFVNMSGESGADRLLEASRQLASWMAGSQGPLGILYHHEVGDAVSKYVLAAMDVWKGSSPSLALIHTLEVVSLAGECVGLIVLPTHPLRVAWQQSFDLLVAHHRYEEGLPAAKVERLLEKVTGAHYPSFLPGLEPDRPFVFADTLGPHAVALVPADDPEPKATVALLGRLLGNEESTAPSVGRGAAMALAGEIGRYLQLHPEYRRIRVHAMRAGDAMPVARALGQAIQSSVEEDEDLAHTEVSQPALCYELDLYPGREQAAETAGRFLSATAERRRSGAGAVPEVDRWMLDSVTRPGGVSLPRLRWARRRTTRPATTAHLAIAFDVFTSRVECRRLTELPSSGVLEAHGLMLMPARDFSCVPHPHWLSFVPPEAEGEKHPVTGILTKRQAVLHALVLNATARQLGGDDKDWPVLVTEVSPDQADLLQDLHGLCDWVITADRNAGIEYFDSPNDLPKVYDSYIIDCVPERDDLGFMQLITSTSSFDEVVNLLDEALGEMGLSASPRNCRFLLDALKAVSGRLALRLAGAGCAAQEMIAVALAHSHCTKAGDSDEVWLSLSDGFFVPLDDVPELFREPGKTQVGERRADLLYVTAQKRGGLKLTFVEIKFRRYLKTARAPDLAMTVESQIDSSCQRWGQLFGTKTSTLEKTVNRAWLARILRFYARKGKRYGLSGAAYANAMKEIDRLVRKEADPPELIDLRRIGFVFCPEYGGHRPASIEHDGQTELWLFGPDLLPEPSFKAPVEPLPSSLSMIELTAAKFAASEEPSDACTAPGAAEVGAGAVAVPDTETANAPISPPANDTGLGVLLGHREPGGGTVIWEPSIRSNPHLMILGLPGMGKTTCLINLCEQLQARQIAPVVFSYHQDIDEKLTARLPSPPLIVRCAGLGFNPMEVNGDGPLDYLDNVGMLRDIFSAIFPDLGDVQLGRLREALKTSYHDKGWGRGQRGEVPVFGAFLDLLRADAKPDRGLLTRLNELDDYGFFDVTTGSPTLLDTESLALIQIHDTQNEYLQRAFATFVLYNLYQNMFRRGPQNRITHAVIFDEAHRAARLKLIPTMVKECRKYGIAFVVASQEAKDFDPSLFTAVANYLALRLNEADARLMAKNFAVSDKVGLYADRIKQMPKYRAMYYGEGMRLPIVTALAEHGDCTWPHPAPKYTSV